jgi:hypothetical protein
VAYTVSTSSIVLNTDILVLLIPLWISHDLTMPLGRKLMVIAFLSFGILVTIVGAVRTSVLVKVFVLEQSKADSTYEVGYTLSNIESGLAIVGTCGPTIKYFLSCCIPSLKNADESSNRGYMYPTAGSQGEARSKRFMRTAKTHSTFKEIDEVELTYVSGEGRQMQTGNTQHGDPMMIKKTVAWTVDNSQEKDSNSTTREHIPRDIL